MPIRLTPQHRNDRHRLPYYSVMLPRDYTIRDHIRLRRNDSLEVFVESSITESPFTSVSMPKLDKDSLSEYCFWMEE